MAEEEKPDEETYLDRRKKYTELRRGGMSDKEAKEKAWPKTTAGIKKNAEEKAEKDVADAKQKAEDEKKE